MNQWLAFLEALWNEHWVAWAFFFGYILLAWTIAWLARRIMKSVVPRFTARSNTTLDDRLVEASTGPLRFIIIAVGLRLALESLEGRIPSFQEGGAYATEFAWAGTAASAVVILAVTALVNGAMKAAVDWYLHEMAAKNDATWDEELLPLVRRILSLLIYFIGTSVIFDKMGYPITALVTTAGVASLAIALAAQETLSNMLGGFVILVDRPFRVGDVIELADGKVGEVIEIGLRSTRIRQFDGNALVVPNKDMANSRITNYALPTIRAAIRHTVGVSYGTDIEKAKQVVLDVLTAHPEILPDPAPGVWFTKFNESSLDLFFSCWVASYRDRFRVTDQLLIGIWKAFKENGIEVPFPQRDVHLHLPEDKQMVLAAKEPGPGR